jgi:hypothetical protein
MACQRDIIPFSIVVRGELVDFPPCFKLPTILMVVQTSRHHILGVELLVREEWRGVRIPNRISMAFVDI